MNCNLALKYMHTIKMILSFLFCDSYINEQHAVGNFRKVLFGTAVKVGNVAQELQKVT